jgi:hypothetical protein
MVQDSTEVVTQEEQQLDARLAELLRTMHREHLSLQEAEPAS